MVELGGGLVVKHMGFRGLSKNHRKAHLEKSVGRAGTGGISC